MDKEILSPRPIYVEDAPKTGTKRLKMGTRNAGVVIDTNKKGMYVNGYYNDSNTTFSVLLKPVHILWEDLEKIKILAFKCKKKYKEVTEEAPSKKYLKTLPIVELNGRNFYIDSERRERRQYSNPDRVVKF